MASRGFSSVLAVRSWPRCSEMSVAARSCHGSETPPLCHAQLSSTAMWQSSRQLVIIHHYFPPLRCEAPVTRLVKVSVVVATLVMVGFAASVIGAYLWAGHHYRQAEHDLAKRDFAAAHAHLQSYLKVHSHDATTHFL